MRILLIYRHPDMGYSIGKVFRPIEKEMKKYAEVHSVYLPVASYKPFGLFQNIKEVLNILKGQNFDIIHITGAEHYLLPFLHKYNVVITVHDIGTDQLKRNIKGYWRYFGWIRTLPLAKRVTFISEFTKKEAEQYIKFADNQTTIIPNPIDEIFSHHIKKQPNEIPVVLHIGTSKRKNLEGIIKALQGILCHLRIIGELDVNDINLLKECKINYSNATRLSDNEIINEYIESDIVSFPSFYEGFGMPILEAQMIGRPVLTSNKAPMNNVCGKGAILVNPSDINSIRNGYIKALENYQQIVCDGIVNVKKYNSERITKMHFENYLSLLNK